MEPLTFISAALALYHLSWLMDEAKIWSALTAVATREITVRQFIEDGWSCAACRGHWVSGAAIFLNPFVLAGWSLLVPLHWSAINGLHVLILKFAAAYTPFDQTVESMDAEGPYPAPDTSSMVMLDDIEGIGD